MNEAPTWEESTAVENTPRWEDSTPVDVPHWDDSTPLDTPQSLTPETDKAYMSRTGQLRPEPSTVTAGTEPTKASEALRANVQPLYEHPITSIARMFTNWDDIKHLYEHPQDILGPVSKKLAGMPVRPDEEIGSQDYYNTGVMAGLLLAGMRGPHAQPEPLRGAPLAPEPPPTVSMGPGTIAADVSRALAERRFTMVPTPPEAPPTFAPVPPIEQTLSRIGQPMPFNPEAGPPFSPEFQMPVQTETARIGGEPDASTITSTTRVPELEVRTQVGEETPLRQPGETTGAQTESVSTGQPVAAETPERAHEQGLSFDADLLDQAKENVRKRLNLPTDLRQLSRLQEQGKAPSRSEIFQLYQDEYDRLSTGHAPESITAELPSEGGPSIRAVSDRPIEAPPPGTIKGWEAATAHGEAWLNQGGDINKVVTDFRKTGKVNELEMGKMNAYLNRLQSVTNQAGDALRTAPNDPKLQKAYQAAAGAEQAFTDAYKPMHTVASGSLAALQGHVPLTEQAAASYTGLSRRFQEFKGEPMTSEEAVKADRLSKKMEKANGDYQKANGEVYRQLDNEYGRIKTTRKGPPTLDDLGKIFGETLQEVCDT